jgi:hypothetical protein
MTDNRDKFLNRILEILVLAIGQCHNPENKNKYHDYIINLKVYFHCFNFFYYFYTLYNKFIISYSGKKTTPVFFVLGE